MFLRFDRGYLRMAGKILPMLFLWLGAVGFGDEHRCIYVNNDARMPSGAKAPTADCSGGNCVSIFSLGYGDDTLRFIDKMPTGGIGIDGSYLSTPQIVATPPFENQGCVFATNAATHDVSAFTYHLHDPIRSCRLKSVQGSPFRTGGSFGELGGGVALSRDGLYLYTSNSGSNSISTFGVDSGCGLTLLARTQIAAKPADIQVNANSTCMAVASPSDDIVYMYDIRQGLPRTVDRARPPADGVTSGIAFSMRIGTPKLYITKQFPTVTIVASYTVKEDCTLADSLVTVAAGGRGAALPQLTPYEDCLFIPNPDSATMTGFAVDPVDGTLTFMDTYPNFPPFTSSVTFATSDARCSLFTNVYQSREIMRRELLPGCVPGPLEQVVSTGVSGFGLARGVVVVQE